MEKKVKFDETKRGKGGAFASIDLGKFIAQALAEKDKVMIADFIFERGELGAKKVLNLSGAGLTQLDRDFLQFTALTTLCLDGNNFEHFPRLVCEFAGLERLSLRACDLVISSRNFAPLNRLKSLEYLDLSENLFSKFPKALFACKRLKTLGLQRCELNFLPEDIARLKQLAILELYCNPDLKALPAALFELKELEMLDLSYCGLKTLPQDFEKLQKLQSLALQGNDFTAFPSVLLRLKKLEKLSIDSDLITPKIQKDLRKNGTFVVAQI